MPDLAHYTLNTGDTRQSPRAELSDDVIPSLRHMLRGGEFPIPGSSLLVHVESTDEALTAAVFVRRDDQKHPIVTFCVVSTQAAADRVWSMLESTYLEISDKGPLAACDMAAPRRPVSLPWCATLVSPIVDKSVAADQMQAMEWLGDFERCLAWTWLERNRHTNN